MLSRLSVAATCFLVFVQVSLSGCAFVDQYSGRAVAYNVEAEQAQEQALLLNIIRASLRKPMQYTSVQTITGTATTSGTANLTFPVGFHPASAFNTGMLGGTVGGGPSFTVPVLDTQEFYQGIMKPIPGQLIDFYVHEEYPREEIFNLFIEKVVLRREDCPISSHLKNCEMTFINYPGANLDLDLTQAVIEYLINLGLSTEKIPENKTKSTKTKDCSSSGDSSKDCSPQPPAFRFCFSPRELSEQAYVDESGRCGALVRGPKPVVRQKSPSPSAAKGSPPAAPKLPEPSDETSTPPNLPNSRSVTEISRQTIGENERKTTTAPIRLSDSLVRELMGILNEETHNGQVDLYGYQSSLPDFIGKRVTVDVYTRSTEGIIYYLGEIVRRRVDPDLNFADGPRTLKVKIGPFYTRIPKGRCPSLDDDTAVGGFRCYNLFALDKGVEAGAPLSVTYGGTQYSVPSDRKEAGKTMHVLSLVKQLLAVNTSAKSLPQTNVISVINP